MNSRTQLFPVAVAAAVLGGGVGAAGVSLLHLGGGTKTTTMVQQAPLSSAQATADSRSQSLTPRDIYKRDAPGVVYIRSQIVQKTASPFDLIPQEQQGEATGSGFVIDKNGEILTNAHVISGAVKVTVQFADQKIVEAKVVGRDVSSDIALIKVDPDGLDLKPLALGSAKSVQVGDPTIAIGNPFGLDRTLTTGVVSALQRKISAPNHFEIDNVIQTDAAINPGNSGGPLLDAAGRVIGINSQIETGQSGSGGNVGIGFAVPIDTAKQILPALKSKGGVQRAYLGITSRTVDGSLSGLSLPAKAGALVQTVERDSPADKAGLRAGNISAQVAGEPVQLGGDIIVAIAGKPVTTADGLVTAISSKKPGDKVDVTVLREGKRKTLTVELGSRPNKSPSGG